MSVSIPQACLSSVLEYLSIPVPTGWLYYRVIWPIAAGSLLLGNFCYANAKLSRSLSDPLSPDPALHSWPSHLLGPSPYPAVRVPTLVPSTVAYRAHAQPGRAQKLSSPAAQGRHGLLSCPYSPRTSLSSSRGPDTRSCLCRSRTTGEPGRAPPAGVNGAAVEAVALP